MMTAQSAGRTLPRGNLSRRESRGREGVKKDDLGFIGTGSRVRDRMAQRVVYQQTARGVPRAEKGARTDG